MSAAGPDSHRAPKSALAMLIALCALAVPLLLAPTKAAAVADQNTNGCTLITAPNGQPVLSCPLTVGGSGPVTVEAYPTKVGKGETVFVQSGLPKEPESQGCLDFASCVPRQRGDRGFNWSRDRIHGDGRRTPPIKKPESKKKPKPEPGPAICQALRTLQRYSLTKEQIKALRAMYRDRGCGQEEDLFPDVDLRQTKPPRRDDSPRARDRHKKP